ncbi:MAG: hypothetical protein LBT03_01270 [Holosporales bacterium]|jgi:hypothetical protein|nr:hypothetical protein [Holosporales bacterium]
MTKGVSRAQVVQVSIFLLLIGVMAFHLREILATAFLYNIQINSVIFVSFMAGVAAVYHRFFVFRKEMMLLIDFDKISKHDMQKFAILKPITFYISRNRKILSQSKMQTILSGVDKKVDDSLAFPKYVTGILIFLGLLGTFWGLSNTIGNVAGIIDNLGFEDSEAANSFLKLKDSLKIPLSGMGVAFGCSLFGLSSSLILGFLNMNLRKAADRFMGEVEEWIIVNTVSFDVTDNYQEYHGEVFSMGLLEKTIEMIYAFQNQLKNIEENRVSIVSLQKDVSLKISKLSDALVSLASANAKESVWEELLKKLDSIEILLNNVVQNSIANRNHIVEDLSREIRMISKTLSSMIRD